MRVRSPSVPRAFWPICMSSSRWPCLLPRQSLLPQPSVWWAAFPPLWRRDWRKARSRPLRGQSGTVPAECLICRKKVASVPRPLGMGRPCPTPCGVLRNPSQYFAASTRVLCGEYNPALRMPFVRFRQRAGRNHGRSFMARGMFVNHFCFAAPVSQPLQKIFSRMSLYMAFSWFVLFYSVFCSS